MTEGNMLAYLLQVKVLPPDDPIGNVQMLLRWIHFLAGITWIGLLYFFNLVNVGFMKKLDAPTKGKVVPALLPSALWWFRWGAVVTVLAGLTYFILQVHLDAANAPEARFGVWLLIWAALVLVAFVLEYVFIRVINNGWALAGVIAALVFAMGWGFLAVNTKEWASNNILSIGVGGGIGIIMLLNVWGIIWPAQKRIIAWTKENAEKGTPIPAESATLARRAFLASRANTWLSIPMLFFMGAAHHYPFLGG